MVTKTAEEVAEKIVKSIFHESCIHADDGHCDNCILAEYPKIIAEALTAFGQQEYKRGHDDGVREGK